MEYKKDDHNYSVAETIFGILLVIILAISVSFGSTSSNSEYIETPSDCTIAASRIC